MVIAGRTRTIDLARSGDKYFVTVLAAGFDAIVNERANRMTWPKGQMRYNIATLAELRIFSPLPYTLELDGVERRLDAMLVAVGNGPSFGGGLRITEGALLDDGLLDVVIIKPMSQARDWCGPTPSCSRAPTSTIRSTSTTSCTRSRSPRRGSCRTPTASASARCPSPSRAHPEP